MVMIAKKLLLISTITFLLSHSVDAQPVRQKTLGFEVHTEQLLKGEIHYFFEILSPAKLSVQYPELLGLDSLSLNRKDEVKLAVNKSMSIISRPVGFFNDQQLVDEKFLSHILGDQSIKKIAPDSYKVQIPGGPSYKMRSFFDSDDMSTLPNPRVIQAVTTARTLDVISKSASLIMVTEKTGYSNLAEGGVSVSSFISLKENLTLVITYNIYAIKKPSLKPDELLKSFIEEIKAQKLLFQNYREQF